MITIESGRPRRRKRSVTMYLEIEDYATLQEQAKRLMVPTAELIRLGIKLALEHSKAATGPGVTGMPGADLL